MKTVTMEQVVKACKGWAVLFADNRTESPQQLTFIAKTYYESLVINHVTDGQFRLMYRMVVERCNWFPKLAEILATKEEAEMAIRASVPQISYELPEPKDEDRAKCLEIIERTASQLGIKLTA